MRFHVLGDNNREFDGKLSVIFNENNKTHELCFNLDKWEHPSKHGLIGANFIKFFNPELTLQFDQEYDYDIENSRKIYSILYYHGWRPKDEKES